ncbi:MAG: Smr/MutS family protein [Rhodocyclaceae bacterium]
MALLRTLRTVSNNKRVPLAQLKRRLKATPAPARALPDDDTAAFRQATAGTVALRDTQRIEIARPAPVPIPRPRDTTAATPEPVRKNTLDLPAAWFDDTPGGPPATPDERLLAHALQGVTPMVSDRVFIEAPKPRPTPVQHQRDEAAALAESIYAPTPLELRLEGGDELAYLRENLPRSLLRDLRRGRWVVQEEIDLHGANRDQARDLLAAFMGHCRKHEIRCVRIVHGKGLGSPGREPVLKKLVAGWLMNYDDVLAYAQARVPDGGAGALLVLLRASRR